MKYLVFLLLLSVQMAFAQGGGVIKKAGVPSNTPTLLQAWDYINTTTGVRYTWSGTAWVANGTDTNLFSSTLLALTADRMHTINNHRWELISDNLGNVDYSLGFMQSTTNSDFVPTLKLNNGNNSTPLIAQLHINSNSQNEFMLQNGNSSSYESILISGSPSGAGYGRIDIQTKDATNISQGITLNAGFGGVSNYHINGSNNYFSTVNASGIIGSLTNNVNAITSKLYGNGTNNLFEVLHGTTASDNERIMLTSNSTAGNGSIEFGTKNGLNTQEIKLKSLNSGINLNTYNGSVSANIDLNGNGLVSTSGNGTYNLRNGLEFGTQINVAAYKVGNGNYKVGLEISAASDIASLMSKSSAVNQSKIDVSPSIISITPNGSGGVGVGKLVVNSSNSLVLPTGTTAEGTSSSTGSIRFNTDCQCIVAHDGMNWIHVTQGKSASSTAIGGSYTFDNDTDLFMYRGGGAVGDYFNVYLPTADVTQRNRLLMVHNLSTAAGTVIVNGSILNQGNTILSTFSVVFSPTTGNMAYFRCLEISAGTWAWVVVNFK